MKLVNEIDQSSQISMELSHLGVILGGFCLTRMVISSSLFLMKHNMKLQPGPFQRMQSGKKTIEIRLNDEKRQQLAVGDEIEFALASNEEERLLTKVESLSTFPSFKEAYQGVFPYKDPDESASMYQYYSEEEEKKYGVLAITISLVK